MKNEISVPLSTLINLSFNTGIFPGSLKLSLLNYVPHVLSCPTCLALYLLPCPHVPRGIRASCLTCSFALRASYPTYSRASRVSYLTCSLMHHVTCTSRVLCLEFSLTARTSCRTTSFATHPSFAPAVSSLTYSYPPRVL